MENKLDQWDIISSAGLTALAIAGLRAVETHRSDSLASDPFAELFVQAAKTEVPIPTRPDPDNLFLRLNASYVGVRTRFFDEYFTAATSAGVHQVVILAAGLDARAFRLDWAPETDLYEIDQPMVLDFKQRVLDTRGAKPKCRRHLVPIDLREDWAGALTAAGFDPNKPTAWLAEGLLSYLPGTPGRPGEFHPRAPTERNVTVSRHSALLIQSVRNQASTPSGRTGWALYA